MRVRRHFGVRKGDALAGAIGVVLLMVGGGLSLAADAQPRSSPNDRLSIDDFSTAGEKGVPAAKWQLVAEKPAGGASAGKVQVEEYEGRTCLHLMGGDPKRDGSRLGTPAASPKSTEGFVEARRSLYARRRPLDAHAYAGIQVTAKGKGGIFAIHLRTADARRLGQYYRVELPANERWQEIKLAFKDFVPVAMVQRLDPARLVSVAIVASTGPSDADIYIDEMAFYREQNMNRNLTPEEERVIVYKGTERPFAGKYDKHFEKGVYTCKRCGTELFESSSKFKSNCGWPSFDEQIPGRVQWQPDADGVRTEVICNHCGAHLGHVFLGEGYTEKNTRYCVNSISMDFTPAEQRVGAGPRARPDESGQPQGVAPTNPQLPQRAIFASGCFWGTEYYLQRAPGVISTTVGFTGGHVEHPTYKQVCTERTGHAEAVEVIYDPLKINYEQLAKLFFETHDFTQLNRQGPDIGPQYRSAIFYLNDEQKQVAERLVQQLRQRGYAVKTEITPAGKFWPAEDYHQDYYNHNGQAPYCHVYRPIF